MLFQKIVNRNFSAIKTEGFQYAKTQKAFEESVVNNDLQDSGDICWNRFFINPYLKFPSSKAICNMKETLF